MDPLSLWFLQNKQDLTAMRLAAICGVPRIFTFILNLDGVYRQLDEHYGVFDMHLFDITEVDPVAHRQWLDDQAPSSRPPTKVSLNQVDPVTPKVGPVTPPSSKPSRAVLEILCSLSTRKAFGFIDNQVIRDILEVKWYAYRRVLLAWYMIHFCFILSMTVSAITRAKITYDDLFGGKNRSDETSQLYKYQEPDSLDGTFVNLTRYIHLIFGILVLLLEYRRTMYYFKSLCYHNSNQYWLYRITLLLMSCSLIIDFVISFVDPDFNFFLILALLLAWWFCTFFLSVCPTFSFFSVMFGKILLGDMPRFFAFIFLHLISFSVAMHVVYITSDPVPEDFRDFGVTMMTMFKLMLGLSDIEILYEARQSWLAVALFVVFVLVTYVLLINSLIALMSQTCALVSEDRNLQCEMQRLAVIIMLESVIPQWLAHIMTRCIDIVVSRYDLQKAETVKEKRYFLVTKYVHTGSRERSKWNDVLRKMGLDEHTMRTTKPSRDLDTAFQTNPSSRTDAHGWVDYDMSEPQTPPQQQAGPSKESDQTNESSDQAPTRQATENATTQEYPYVDIEDIPPQQPTERQVVRNMDID